MRRVAAGLLGALLAVGTTPAGANPTVAGTQPAPPVHAGAPVLNQELDARRHVRGCTTDDDCRRPTDILREFELERIPRPGGSPWITERDSATSRLERRPVRIAKKGSDLRPDAPWLDQLAMPDLPVRWSQRLADYLVFYRDDPRGRAIMGGWLRDQGRYRDLIVSYLRKAKLPEDLLYVAMIESSYDPDELSRAGALGVWQWMPAGARIYGLRRDRWVDERRDPYRSTIAQMDYFRDLYQRFGDWHIALAAFNVGYGAMLQAIARYNTNDYYQLCSYENALPYENCWYTPKVLAAAIVGRNRAAFRFDKIKPAPAEVWEDVAVPTSIPLAVIAHAAGVDEATIKRLNPHLRQGRTPPGEVGYQVRVPAGRRADAQRRLAELQSQWDGYDAYVVAHGERFEDIAMTFGVNTWALRKLNGVTNEAEIGGGTVLVVPRVSEDQKARNRARAKAKLHSSGIDQREGEPLVVAIPDKDHVERGKKRVFYRVVSGDTLRSVGKAFGVKPADLARWSDIEPDAKLHPRMVLVAWVAPDFDPDKRHVVVLDETQVVVVTRGSVEHLDLAAERMGRVRTEYIAQTREKLEDIAKKFGMKARDLARINRMTHTTVLAKGDKIVVYQAKDPTRSERAEKQWKKTPARRRGKIVGARAVETANAHGDDKRESRSSNARDDRDKHDDKRADDHDDDDAKSKSDEDARDEDHAAGGSGPVVNPSDSK